LLERNQLWPIWEIDFEGWSIRKGFKRFLKRKDPKTIPRVDRSYTVIYTSTNDPSGDIGVYIRCESRNNYEYRYDEYDDKNEKLWAELLGAMTGDAKLLAMSCQKGDGKAVLEKLRGRYNKSSSAKLCTRIINFVNLTKQGKDSVESHSTKWAEEMRQLEHTRHAPTGDVPVLLISDVLRSPVQRVHGSCGNGHRGCGLQAGPIDGKGFGFPRQA
jgi:hypothetical protein